MNKNIKPLIKIIIALIAFALVTFIALKAYDYVQHTLPPTQVDIAVNYSPDRHCRADSPLYVAIFNDSHRTINKSSFTLSAKGNDSEDNLIQMLASTYNKQSIIRPGETYEGCWPYPKLKSNEYAPEELIFEVKRKMITFGN